MKPRKSALAYIQNRKPLSEKVVDLLKILSKEELSLAELKQLGFNNKLEPTTLRQIGLADWIRPEGKPAADAIGFRITPQGLKYLEVD